MTNSALIAKLRYNANTEYSTPRNPPSKRPNFTSPKPMLSFFKINCPMRPILKRKPAKTTAVGHVESARACGRRRKRPLHYVMVSTARMVL